MAPLSPKRRLFGFARTQSGRTHVCLPCKLVRFANHLKGMPPPAVIIGPACRRKWYRRIVHMFPVRGRKRRFANHLIW